MDIGWIPVYLILSVVKEPGWLFLVLFSIIALRVVASGGGWFEIMNANTRLGNQIRHVEFNWFTWLLTFIIFSGIVWVLIHSV